MLLARSELYKKSRTREKRPTLFALSEVRALRRAHILARGEKEAAHQNYITAARPRSRTTSLPLGRTRRAGRVAVQVVFRVEGGLVANQVPWPLAAAKSTSSARSRVPDATEMLELMRGDIPRLNEARVDVMGAPHD